MFRWIQQFLLSFFVTGAMKNMFQFASGSIFVVPTGGNLPTNPTPMKLGTLQDASVEFSCTLKDLRGQLQFPDDVAPGDKKITWKAMVGKVEIALFNQVFFADSYTTGGQTNQADSEAHAIPATPGPYTVTVTNSANFNEDEGVVYASGPNVGAPLIRVASGPTTGQYSVSAGTYTFAAADQGLNVLISYNYNNTTTGATLTVNSQWMGYGPTFEMWFYWRYQGQSGLWLSTCRASKVGTPTKRDNYLIVDMEGEAYANPSGVVAKWFQGVA